MSTHPRSGNQQSIRTTRLLLQPARTTDLPVLQKLWNEPLGCVYGLGGELQEAAVAAERLQLHLRQARDGLGLWLLRSGLDGHAMGCASLARASRRHRGALKSG